jgi:hypothetical protein
MARDKSLAFMEALELGKKIAAELDTTDTLGRWMAHDLASKMKEAEQAAGKEREQRLLECREYIFKIWSHRSELPRGAKPFEDFEAIYVALKNLDPSDNTPRYAPIVQLAGHEKSKAGKDWLNAALFFDKTARLIIRYCLISAASKFLKGTEEWINLAKAANVVKDRDLEIVVEFISTSKKIAPKSSKEVDKEYTQKLVTHLEAFIKMADQILKSLKNRLSKL